MANKTKEVKRPAGGGYVGLPKVKGTTKSTTTKQK